MKVLAILRKEINEFFSSLTAYITVSLFLVTMGLFLWVFPDTSILEYGYANLDSLFFVAPWVFVFLIPAITMRFFAEEKRMGTYELLVTAPVSHWALIIGKFLAGVLLVLFCLLPTLVYYYSVYQLGAVKGNLDSGAIAGSYLGLLLLGTVFTAIGLFASTCSRNQAVAFMLAVFLCFFAWWGFDAISTITSLSDINFLLVQLGIFEHYQSLSRGVIDTRDLAYFFSLSFLFLLAAKLRLSRPKPSMLLWAPGLIAVNILLFNYFTRIDLTADKRHTLSASSRELLKKIDQPLVVRVFLEGDLSTDIKRLQAGVKDLLNEYAAWADGNMHVEFIDPLASADGKKGNATYQQLTEAGLEPTSLNIRREEGNLQKIIFPGALLSYKGRQLPVNFLGTRMQTRSAAESIHRSVQDLEYKFSDAISRLTDTTRTRIGFLAGHGELRDRQLIDITGTLNRSYEVKQVNLERDSLAELAAYATLILAKPRESFSEAEKYQLDQYLMQGGRLLIFADRFNASLDSMQARGNMLALPIELNLNDLFFRYGFRINYDLIQDMNCAPIPVVLQTGQQGNQQLMPWLYYPLILPQSQHPIARNLDPLRMQFVSSIDTLAVPGIQKTVLLQSSPYTQKMGAPVYLSLESIGAAADPSAFKGGRLPLALLLEGSFKSAFQNRNTSRFDQSRPFRTRSEATAIIAVADGDMIANEVSALDGSVFPLGYDKYTRQTFGNKEFVLNAVDYLAGRGDILDLRRRTMGLRMLNRQRAASEALRWKLINTLLPVALVLLFSLGYNFRRKQKYAHRFLINLPYI